MLMMHDTMSFVGKLKLNAIFFSENSCFIASGYSYEQLLNFYSSSTKFDLKNRGGKHYI